MNDITSLILFEGLPTIDGRKLVADIGWRWPDLATPTNLVKGVDDVRFALGEAVVLLAAMNEPMEFGDFDERGVAEKLWPLAKAGLYNHQSHMVLTVALEGRRKLDVVALATKITSSALAAATNPLGVYWPTTPQLIAPDVFMSRARGLPSAALDLWVSIAVGKGRDGTATVVTSGLHVFGLREIEVVDAPESPQMLEARVRRLVSQLVVQRRNVSDGATLEHGAEHTVRVRVGPSTLGRDREVSALVFAPSDESEIQRAAAAASL